MKYGWCGSAICARAATHTTATPAAAGAAQARLDRVQRMIHTAYKDKLEGCIDEAFFDSKRAEWERQRTEAQAELRRLASVGFRHLDTGARLLKLANQAFKGFIDRNPSDQRRLLEAVYSNFTLADGQVTPIWRKPFDILALSTTPPEKENADSGSPNRRHPVSLNGRRSWA